MTRLSATNTESENVRFSLCFVALHASSIFSGTPESRSVGGAEVQQYLIGNELVQRGVIVKFVIKDDPLVKESHVRSIELLKAYDPTRGIKFIRGIYPQFIKLWRMLSKANCDAYYVRGAKYESGITWLYCICRKKTMIQAIAHDYDCSLDTLHNLKGSIKKYLYLRALKGADLVLAQTSVQQQLLRNNLNLQSEVLPNLVNVSPYIKKRPEGGIKSLLWVGTIKPIKRPHLYLELAREFPDLSFTMIGPVSNKFETYRREFNTAAESVRNLQFVDYVPAQEIATYFEKTDIFVSTSEMEGFPNVFLQAWAHGKPVLSYVDPDHVIKRHELGWVVADKQKMVGVIQQATADAWGDKLSEIGLNAVNYVEANHAANKLADKLLEKILHVVCQKMVNR